MIQTVGGNGQFRLSGDNGPAVAATFAAPFGLAADSAGNVYGVEAATSYTGLAPGFSGLYQINATIPAGVTPGGAVAVQLQVAGQTSEAATIAVR